MKSERAERLSLWRVAEQFEHAPLNELGARADSVRLRLHPEGRVTFTSDRNINYTNVCVSRCRFCAFCRRDKDPEAYVLSFAEIGARIEQARAAGAVQILLQGGMNPALGLGWHLDLLRFIRSEHPIHVHGYSAPEIDFLCGQSGLPLPAVLERLVASGLGSIPGGGAEVLSSRVRRRVSPRKIGVRRWLEVHEAAHRMGLRTTATMVYGLGETFRDRLVHLRHIQRLQARTGGFTAFIPWSFQPGNTTMDIAKSGPALYLRILAVSRILLDNVPNLQVSWVTQGPEVAQLALYYGANDFGSTMMEENVVRAAGCSFKVMDESAIAALVRGAGFIPALRHQDYSLIRTL
ncbi:dehypoxanthine futalosine cyclase [bacterium]|nr:dehypoxanthine futalosine cyclase [bacterium]